MKRKAKSSGLRTDPRKLVSIALILASPKLPIIGIAQPLGMPAAHHPWHWLSVSASIMRQDFDARTSRFYLVGPIVKASFAPVPFLELAVAGGALDWRYTSFWDEESWWSAGYRPAAAIGGWLEPSFSEHVSAFAAAQLLVFWGKGAFYSRSDWNGILRITTWIDVQQILYAGRACSGIGFRAAGLRLYLGLAGRDWWREVESRGSILTTSGWSRAEAERRDENWAAQFGPFVGIQVGLPGRLFVSVEGTRWSSKDFAVSIGLGQIGPP